MSTYGQKPNSFIGVIRAVVSRDHRHKVVYFVMDKQMCSLILLRLIESPQLLQGAGMSRFMMCFPDRVWSGGFIS